MKSNTRFTWVIITGFAIFCVMVLIVGISFIEYNTERNRLLEIDKSMSYEDKQKLLKQERESRNLEKTKHITNCYKWEKEYKLSYELMFILGDISEMNAYEYGEWEKVDKMFLDSRASLKEHNCPYQPEL